MGYVHLHTHSSFSFLDGASSVDSLVSAAAGHGMAALAITDHNSVSAAVRFAKAAKSAGIKPITGCELTFDGFVGGNGPYHLTLLAVSPAGYANLCRILTRTHRNQNRGVPLATPDDLAGHTTDIIALSGCRRGELPALLLRGKTDAARQAWERAKKEVQVRENSLHNVLDVWLFTGAWEKSILGF